MRNLNVVQIMYGESFSGRILYALREDGKIFRLENPHVSSPQGWYEVKDVPDITDKEAYDYHNAVFKLEK